MNVYLDTSAIVKLYVIEEGTTRVKETVAGARLIGTSLIAYLEACSAFARRYREGDLTTQGYRTAIEGFDSDWDRYFVTRVDEVIVKAAALLAAKNALKALDALHLASARALVDSIGIPCTFLAADQRLIRAAIAEGLEAIYVGT